MTFIAYRPQTGYVFDLGDNSPDWNKETGCINFGNGANYDCSEENTVIEEVSNLPEDFTSDRYRFINNEFEKTEFKINEEIENEKKRIESLAEEIRNKRNMLLSETDWTALNDTKLSDEVSEKYKTYRQALRDITTQESFPEEINWPILFPVVENTVTTSPVEVS